MSENNFTSVMESLLKGVDSVISTKTVVGEAKQIGDTIILPDEFTAQTGSDKISLFEPV